MESSHREISLHSTSVSGHSLLSADFPTLSGKAPTKDSGETDCATAAECWSAETEASTKVGLAPSSKGPSFSLPLATTNPKNNGPAWWLLFQASGVAAGAVDGAFSAIRMAASTKGAGKTEGLTDKAGLSGSPLRFNIQVRNENRPPKKAAAHPFV